MKKRIALAAAIALAISIGGMLPASAAKLGAPVIATDSCARAGGTLEVKERDGDISVALGAGVLVITTTSADCSGASLAVSGLTSVILKATDETDDATDYGDITINLESGVTAGTLANFGSIPMTIQAEGVLSFDGSGMTEAGAELRPIVGTISEEAFTLGSVTGSYYAGGLNFAGGDAGDSLDASSVTTTGLTATGGEGTDLIKAGAGDDTLSGGTQNDNLYGNAGDDSLNTSDGGSTSIPRGNSGKFKIISLPSGSDEAWGGTGSDTIVADAADIVAPGDGSDGITLATGTVLSYGDSSAAITVNLTSAVGVVRAAPATTSTRAARPERSWAASSATR